MQKENTVAALMEIILTSVAISEQMQLLNLLALVIFPTILATRIQTVQLNMYCKKMHLNVLNKIVKLDLGPRTETSTRVQIIRICKNGNEP